MTIVVVRPLISEYILSLMTVLQLFIRVNIVVVYLLSYSDLLALLEDLEASLKILFVPFVVGLDF